MANLTVGYFVGSLSSTSINRRLANALDQQGMPGAMVGVEGEQGRTLDIEDVPALRVRANLVRIGELVDSDAVAEAVAFLSSGRSALTDRATVTVGSSRQ